MRIETVVANTGLHTRTVMVSAVVEGPEGSVVGHGRSPGTLVAGGAGIVHERLWVERPALWNLDDPHLHTVNVKVEEGDAVDECAGRFGIRKLQLDGLYTMLRARSESTRLPSGSLNST